MGRRSKVLGLPAEVKAWLDAALVAGNFSDYELLAAELKARGHAISKSSVHRYGEPFQQMMAKVKLSGEQASALMAEAGDDKGAMNDALIRMIQQKTFEVLMLERLTPDVDGEPVTSLATDPKFVRAIATLVRASVTQKDWAANVRKEDAAKLSVIEAEAVKGTGPKKIDLETLRYIRESIYGF